MGWFKRITNTFRSNKLQRDLEEELRHHLDLRTADYEGSGMTPDEARLAATRQFGNPTLEKERARTMDISAWLETLLKDLRYAARQFLRNPVFTIVAVLSLAIGIGANTSIFSLMNAVLLRSLPVHDPHELVALTDPNTAGVSVGLSSGERGLMSYAEYEQIRDHAKSFSGLCVVEAELDRWQVRINGAGPEDARPKLVSENYFSVLGVEPFIGRVFNVEDAHAPGQNPYVVLSYDYWKNRFGGNASALGTPIRILGTTYSVIGVAAPGFHGENISEYPDFWLPMMMQPSVMPGRDWLREDLSKNFEKVMWLHAFGRLAPGVTLAKAQAEVDVLFKNIIENGYPSTLSPETRKEALDQKLKLREASTGAFGGREDFAQQLMILLGASGVVLLIACINVANLLLARASARNKEVGVRLSIGASRGRLVRQFLTESLLLAFMGGMVGLLIAWGGSHLFAALLAGNRDRFDLNTSLDLRVLAFTMGISLLTGILFGLTPALRGTRVNLNDSLRDGGRATASSGRLNLAKGLVVLQMGLSLLAITGAGLLLRTLWNLQAVDVGYPKEKLLLVGVDGTTAGYKGPQLTALWRDLTARLQSLPGVTGATYSINGLFSGSESADVVEVEGFTPQTQKDRGSRFDLIGPAYFSTVGVPMLRGREIGQQDTAAAPRVVVINEAFAKKFFAGRDPMGRHITERFGDHKAIYEVVGVARNLRDHNLKTDVFPRFYVSGEQGMEGPNEFATFEIRTAGDPRQMFEGIRKTILSVNQDLQLDPLRTLTENLDRTTAQPRMMARLCTLFGLVALLLAATGLYGVLSYAVTRRTNEIGVRMALGAGRGQVVSMILRETGIMILIGALVGVAGSAGLAKLIQSRLFGLKTLDPVTITTALAILAFVALVAGYIPAMRAARVNPVRALRHE